MKTCTILTVLLLTAAVAIAGEESKTVVGKFVRKTGQITLDERGSTLSITEDSPAKWSLKMEWQVSKNLTLKDAPDILRSHGWFVYVETSDRLWIYDGDKHLIFAGHENQKGQEKIVGGMTPEIWATCPKEVLEALPEKAGGKKKPNKVTAANAGWRTQFRLRGSLHRPGVAEF